MIIYLPPAKINTCPLDTLPGYATQAYLPRSLPQAACIPFLFLCAPLLTLCEMQTIRGAQTLNQIRKTFEAKSSSLPQHQIPKQLLA
jgi:hypothetical protein